MRVAVLGCTGGTGKEVVRQGLARGWEILALARNPAKLNEFTHDRLQVAKCDVYDGSELARHLEGCEAVVSCLGVRGFNWPWSTVTLYSDTIKVITLAMRQAQVQRLVLISSWCTVEKEGNPAVIEWFLKPLFIRPVLKDMAIMEEYLVEQDESIQYTVVKPPGLSDGPETTALFKTAGGEEHVKDAAITMQRGDVARFILDSLASETWLRQKVAIGV